MINAIGKNLFLTREEAEKALQEGSKMFERLTAHTPDNFGYAEYQLKQHVDEQDAISRLAAYEDSGLSPEDILGLKDYAIRYAELEKRYREVLKEADDLERQMASAKTALALADMVRRLEWSLKRKLRKTSPECEYYCPICENNKRIGHVSDCELATLLQESEVEKDG